MTRNLNIGKEGEQKGKEACGLNRAACQIPCNNTGGNYFGGIFGSAYVCGIISQSLWSKNWLKWVYLLHRQY